MYSFLKICKHSKMQHYLLFFNTFQQSWNVLMHSVCLSVCTRSISRKYYSNALKLMYVIHILHNTDRGENVIHTTNSLSTETHQSFLIHYGSWGGCLKHILKYLYCTKYNVLRFVIQKKHISHEKWHKQHEYYVYQLTQNFSNA